MSILQKLFRQIQGMPLGSLVLLDDIASILDDVSLMTKVAAKKTAGVLILAVITLSGRLRRR